MAIRFGTCFLSFLLPGIFAFSEDLPKATIHRATEPVIVDGRMDEAAWHSVKPVREFRFPWWTEGEKEKTEARLLWDDEYLYVCFLAFDRHISAVHTERDDPVSMDDCVEVFVAPDPSNVNKYFNFEINALGTLLDRSPKKDATGDWDAEGIRIMIRIDGTLNNETDEDRLWTTEIAIPFEVFQGFAASIPPKPGDTWRLNLYRIGGKVNPQFSVWSETQTPQPNYHVPERFGIIEFRSQPPR